MGHNVDLIEMYGLEPEHECPKCHNKTNQSLEEYDIDCGNVFLGNGVINLSFYCDICENEWEHRFKVKVEILTNE